MTGILSRASVLVVNDENQFVLIFRHKNGQNYYAIPGGGIETGETPEQAATREIDEELGLKLKDLRQVSEIRTSNRHDFNFLAKTNDHEFNVTGLEKNHLNDSEDLFKPLWINKNNLDPNIPIYPEASREMFNDFIKSLK